MSKKSIAQAICLAMQEEMRRDDSVILLGEDVGIIGGSFTTSKGLYKEFGEKRIIDTPICENGYASIGVGAAIGGLRPIVEYSFMDFVLVGIDPIINQAAKLRTMFGAQLTVPVVFRMAGGLLPGAAAQHTQNFEAFFVHTPGLKVVYPSNANDARGLLKSAVRDDNPVVFVEPKGLYFDRSEIDDDPDFLVEIGKADVVIKGSDITLVSYGPAMKKCRVAVQELADEGVSAEFIDLRSISPIDWDTVYKSVKKTGCIVAVTEAVRQCSVASEVVAKVSEELFSYLKAPVGMVGAKFMPLPYSPELENRVIPQIEDIKESVKKTLKSKKG